MTEAGDTEKEFLAGLSGRSGAKNLPVALAEFLDTYNQIGLAYLPQIPIELALVKIFKQ